MEYNEIASVAGKSGLYKVVKPTRTGVILESLDDTKKKLVANATQRISVLSDISIYTTNADDSRDLPSVLHTIYKEFDEDPGVDGSSDSDELKAFLKHVLPEYDEERVYPSDIKKVVTWYRILRREAPELLQNEQSTSDSEADQ